MPNWREIPDFSGYSVSDMGEVRNDRTGRILVQTHNQQGMPKVNFSILNEVSTRSVALLVANAFLPETNEIFNTPINLDGDRDNNRADNLMWRPRWFAIKYHMQFHDPHLLRIISPIRDTTTGKKFRNSTEAAIMYGLLEKDIAAAIFNRTYVFPTYQMFEVVDD